MININNINILLGFVIFVGVVVVAKYCTDLHCHLAKRFNLVDHPNALRKLQKESIPVGGGLAVLVAAVLFLAICHLVPEISPLLALTDNAIFVFLAALFIVAGGLVDDKRELRGTPKLLIQVVAVVLPLIIFDNARVVSLFGFECDLGWWFYPLGMLWFVGMINAINFLDGADGVAATSGIALSLAAGALAVLNGQNTIVVVAIVFAGALLGFLFCNFPPAKVYLGDAGSMLIGLMVGMLLLGGSTDGNRVVHIVPMLTVAIIPIFDLTLAFFRRIDSGRGLFAADRGHIHHRLLVRFAQGRKPLVCFVVLYALSGGAAYIAMRQGMDWLALLVSVLLPCGLMLMHLFGCEEFIVFLQRIGNVCDRLLNPRGNKTHSATYCYQGNGAWTSLWEELLPLLQKHHCIRATLDINIPSYHENFIARWKAAKVTKATLPNRKELTPRLDVPLMSNERQMGWMKIHCDSA
ncbi:MAG: undecaprenyl/decaprenyl-phosphate alpha-N-acetylglucosaminyl 1-phosphate transferase, partial [Acidobacteriota bacterium]|nr:undecaprenyl/decaprenyl-phosphate alpha-N-acetylglucosaminyl 1-phosphate transferase [Acidobacteriota bacterium]